MYCVKCGKEIPNDSKFCPLCGAAVEESASVSQKTEAPKKKRKSAVRSQEDIKGERVADTIYLCQDGKYRWVYEMPMLKNPTILYTVWKVLGISFGAVFLLFQIINLFEDNFSVESLLSSLKVFGLLALAFLIISFYYRKNQDGEIDYELFHDVSTTYSDYGAERENQGMELRLRFIKVDANK